MGATGWQALVFQLQRGKSQEFPSSAPLWGLVNSPGITPGRKRGGEGLQERVPDRGSERGTGVLASELPHCPPVDASGTDPSRMPGPWALQVSGRWSCTPGSQDARTEPPLAKARRPLRLLYLRVGHFCATCLRLLEVMPKPFRGVSDLHPSFQSHPHSGARRLLYSQSYNDKSLKFCSSKMPGGILWISLYYCLFMQKIFIC